MNKIMVVGRLTHPPEIKQVIANGEQRSLCELRLAVPDNDKSDANTLFITASTWGRVAETCAKYLVQGQLLAVAGTLIMRRYSTKEGVERVTYSIKASDVQFLTKPAKHEAETTDQDPAAEIEEDLPF